MSGDLMLIIMLVVFLVGMFLGVGIVNSKVVCIGIIVIFIPFLAYLVYFAVVSPKNLTTPLAYLFIFTAFLAGLSFGSLSAFNVVKPKKNERYVHVYGNLQIPRHE